jgi:DNA-binding CsgD family transcriptional regulator
MTPVDDVGGKDIVIRGHLSLPHAAGAVVNVETLSTSGSDDAGLLRALVDPALIVGGDRRLQAVNDALQQLLSASAALSVDAENRLYLADPALDRAFADVIVQAGRTDAALPLPDLLLEDRLRSGPSPDRHPNSFTLIFMPVDRTLDGPPRDSLSAERKMLVVLRRRPSPSAIATDKLQQRYSLTQTEARLALALREGGTLISIAEQLGMAYGTARAHLRAIFAKTGTHRQHELVALVVRLAAAPRSEL